MNLFLLRHGIAVDRGLPGYEDDSQRPLTSKGASRIHRIAQVGKRLGLKFDLVLSSPSLRAQQTAQTVAAFYKMEDRLRLSENLSPGASPAELIGEIHENYADVLSILLVGHEPYLSTLAGMLLAGDEKVALALKKGGLCKFSIDELRYDRCATLEWLMTPKLMLNLD
ncbi:MAG: phosphohistidine phosphatase SixA [Anaerolineales bacterium]